MRFLFRAFAKWWISLSEEEQKRFYSKAEDETFENFTSWIERLIDEKIKGKSSQKHEINIAKSIEDVKLFIKYKLPSSEEKKALSDLRKALGREESEHKKNRKKA